MESERTQFGLVCPCCDDPGESEELLELIERLNPNNITVIMSGQSMKSAGIDDGDHLLFKRNYNPALGEIVCAVTQSEELMVRVLTAINGRLHLEAATPGYEPVLLGAGSVLGTLWGKLKYAEEDKS